MESHFQPNSSNLDLTSHDLEFESFVFKNMFIRFTSSHEISPFLLIFFLQLHFSLYIYGAGAGAVCPIDFSYVETIPWDASLCHEPLQSLSSCCQSLRSLFGVGLAHYLRQSSVFYLPDVGTSSSCIASFGQKVESFIPMSGSGNFFQSSCINDTAEFVNKGPASDSSCAGIVTTDDWVQKVGKSSIPLESSCNGDMAGLSKCSMCQDAGFKMNTYLVSLHPNSTKCFFFAILYAAAIINDFGPDDARTASCILALPLSRSKNPKPGEKTLKFVIFGVVGGLVGTSIAVFLFLVYRKWDVRRKLHLAHESYVNSVKSRVSAKWFHIAELEQATNGFSPEHVIGRGGYSVVYKGTLLDGAEVAVKEILDLNAKADEEFINEVDIISSIKHRNLLGLKGFCVASDSFRGKRRYLVYDFMSNGSLDDNLFGSGKIQTPLSWPQRKNIILDVAKGIAYLHDGIKPAVYHRDIKATNILLDSDMKARVSDFGLAKQTAEGGQSHVTTRVAGTYGYLAPEYALYGQLTDKSDVYSFGVLILEIMSGRRVLDASEFSNILITDWAWALVKSGKVEQVLDGGIRDEGRKGVMERFVLVGVLCGHVMVALRPTIADALRMLEGDMDIPMLPERWSPLSQGLFLHDSTVVTS